MAQVQQPQGKQQQQQQGGTGPKILRIGIIQGGKIVEERLVRKRENVTIGQSAKNTFVVPASNVLPRSMTLFEITPQGYALNFTEGMDGRIAFDQNVAPVTLAQLRSKAVKRGEYLHVQLSDRARGKVVIGDVTILFQFVAPPPVQPRPQLPPSVRGSITQNLDWMLIGIVGVSLFSHLGFVVYLRSVDFPRKPDIEEIPDRFVQMIVPKKKEEPQKLEQKVDPNAEAAKKAADAKAKADEKRRAAAEAKKEAAAKPRDPEAEARAAAERRARLAADVSKMGVLKVLGAKGEGGTVADLLRGGDPGGDADKVFNSVGGVATASSDGGSGLRSRGAGGSGSVRGIAGLKASGPGEVSSGERGGEREAKVRGSLKEVSKVEVDGTLSADVVVATIRQRKGAIIACYERALKRNPTLGGKIELHFTISSVGKVTGADIEGNTLNDDEVGTCITSIVKTWRFPAPSGGDVQFSYPFIFQPSK